MRKFGMFVLVFVLIFGVSAVTFAGCGQTKCLPVSETLEVIAINPLQGRIDGLPTTTQSLGTFDCGDGSQLSGVYPFTIRSNGYLKVDMNLEPFGMLGEAYKIPSHAQIDQTNNTRFFGRTKLVAWYNWANKTKNKLEDSYRMFPLDTKDVSLLGNGIRNYDLNIAAKLGNIEDQPHGVYRAKTTITLSAWF